MVYYFAHWLSKKVESMCPITLPCDPNPLLATLSGQKCTLSFEIKWFADLP